MLKSIERNYGCVAEYYRSLEDDRNHEAELRENDLQYYKANKEKLESSEELTLWYSDDCVGCEHYESVGMTSEWDDIEHGICHTDYCKRKKANNPEYTIREYELLPANIICEWDGIDDETCERFVDRRHFKTVRDAEEFVKRYVRIYRKDEEDGK